MITSTLTATPVLPDLDPQVGEQLGDEILLSAASQEKVARVRTSSRRTLRRGDVAESRAWSMGGNVD